MMGALVSKEFSGVSVFVRREQLAPKLSVHSSRRGQVHRKTWRMTEALKCTVNAIIHCVGSNSGDVQITEFFSHKHILSYSLWGVVDIMATWLRQKVVYVSQTLHKQIWSFEKNNFCEKSLYLKKKSKCSMSKLVHWQMTYMIFGFYLVLSGLMNFVVDCHI